VQTNKDTRPAAGKPPSFYREGKPMSEQMIVLIVELAIGILRLIEAAYN
jgi:hypothetical protein